MARQAGSIGETSSLLPNKHVIRTQTEPGGTQAVSTIYIVLGIGFSWLASFLAAVGELPAFMSCLFLSPLLLTPAAFQIAQLHPRCPPQ
jgi:hypothetical protein